MACSSTNLQVQYFLKQLQESFRLRLTPCSVQFILRNISRERSMPGHHAELLDYSIGSVGTVVEPTREAHE